jgi:phosphoglycolate phosphatase-like HAD superfamily hydrolase
MRRVEIKQPTWSDLKKYECVFFDFDGVIVESGDIKTEAFMELYEAHGIQEAVKKHHLENQGVSRFDKFEWIAKNLLNETYSEEKGAALGGRFSALVKENVIKSPSVLGVNELILALKENNTYLVVASGTPEHELKEIMKSRQIDFHFDEIHGSPKSKVSIVQRVMKSKGYAPDNCLFIGDASTDYEAAQQECLGFYARLTPELADYWQSVPYQFGTEDFDKITY